MAFFEYIDPESNEPPETRFTDPVTPPREALAGWGAWVFWAAVVVALLRLL